MLKKLTLVLLLLSFCKAYSQQAAVSQKKTIFFEKVYLHLDREFYYSGEDIWFKAYLLNGQGNQLMSTSNNLYVELIDPNAQIKDRKVIRLDNGTGSGDFKLGDTILSGTYKVRAYTNWMLNFGYNFVFERDINVISAVNLGTHVTGTGSVLTPRSKMVSSSGKNLINFFPEGGSLIEGVTSVLAFKSEDFAGKGVKAKGAVVLSNGDTVIRFESNGLGFGSFLIKPETGLKYQIKVAFADGEKFSALLPESQPQGFSLHLMQDSLKVTAIISTNEAT